MSDYHRYNWKFVWFVMFVIGFFAANNINGQPTTTQLPNEQNNSPVGAFRIYPKTHFQCSGRPSGYYADVESGCQVYHMCDELGRQFSYSCPNTTLFQQRMLICDHWYMVNCSRAESNYAANLLIGQKDKPFVPEEEDIQRTPRPDLLDRPYAPDYLGESFRNQYKFNPQIINSLDDVDLRKQSDRKSSQQSDQTKFSAHYSVPGHWTLANVPGYRSTTESTQHSKPTESDHSRYSARSTDEDLGQKKTARRRQDDIFKIEIPSDSSSYFSSTTDSNQNNGNVFDLGVSASQDSRRSEDESNFENSLHLDRPFTHHKQLSTVQSHTFSTTTLGTNVPTTTVPLVTSDQEVLKSTTASIATASHHSSTDANNNFEFLRTSTRANSKYNSVSLKDELINQKPSVEIKSRSKSEQSVNVIDPAVLIPSIQSTENRPTTGIHLPARDLLPPFETLRLYDDSTTQGPSIYYQWKMPASALEPPEYSEKSNAIINDHINKSHNKNIIVPIDHLQPPKLPNETNPVHLPVIIPATDLLPPLSPATTSTNTNQNVINQFANNPFLASAFALSTATSINNDQQKSATNKSPTPRSISSPSSQGNFIQNQLKKLKDTNYLDLRKSLFIPNYTFPLETDGNRGSYQIDKAVNSFQIKIPKSNDTPWYGENDQCPECHPSFLKPGSCEPCIKIR